MSRPLLETDLNTLISALDEARGASVPRQEINKAEEYLKSVASKQGKRARAEDRLRSVLRTAKPESPGASPKPHASSNSMAELARQDAEEALAAWQQLDTDELAEAIEMAKAAGVDPKLCEKAALVLTEAIAA